MAETDLQFPDLTPLLAPKAIAVVGASRDLAKMGGRCVHYLKRHGFPGQIVPVNPSGGEIQGLASCASISDVPEGTDCALLAISGAQVPGALEECAGRGIRAAIVLASGFAETGAEGRAAQDELTELARRLGILVCGPNSNGLVNVNGRMAATSNPTLDADLLPGGIAVISQSGGLSLGSMLYLGPRRNIGFNYQISTGNEAGVEAADFAWHCLHDETTTAIALLVEGFRTPAKILAVAAEAARREIPVTLLKLGRTATGRRIAASHTALLTGTAEVQSAFLARAGIVEVSDVEELYEVAHLCARARAVRGGKLAVLSPSGGGAILAADICADLGVPLADLSAETGAAIGAVLPDFAAIDNPLDLTAIGTSDPTIYPACLDALLRDDDVAAALVFFTVNRDFDPIMHAVVDRSRASDKPLVCVGLGGGLSGRGFAILEEGGMPVFRSMHDGIRAARSVLAYAAFRERGPARPSARMAVNPPLVAPELAGTQTEAALYPLLQAAGLPVLPSRVVADVDGALAAAAEIGYPIVLKGVAPAIPHKTEAGLVRLGVDGPGALRDAWTSLAERMGEHVREGVVFDGVLVQKHARRGLEAIVGVKHEPGWGSVVVVGLGGVLAEALADTVIAPVPLAPGEAVALPRRLRAARLLDGFRDEPPRDLEALGALVEGVSALAEQLGDRLVELDLNPVIVYERGQGVAIADALAVLAGARAEEMAGREQIAGARAG
jgi:acyl-CoA synthetase (NDP forming)